MDADSITPPTNTTNTTPNTNTVDDVHQVIQSRMQWYSTLTNQFQQWIQQQLDHKWMTISLHHMAHEWLVETQTRVNEYTYDKDDEDYTILQEIQSRYATFITNYGCPSLSTAVRLILGKDRLQSIQHTSTVWNVLSASSSASSSVSSSSLSYPHAMLWNVLDSISHVQRISYVLPSTESVSFDTFSIYDVEHKQHTLQQFQHSMYGIYLVIKTTATAKPHVFHLTLPPLTIHEIPQFHTIRTWKTHMETHRPEQETFQLSAFSTFLETYSLKQFLFAHKPQDVCQLFYGHYSWSKNTLQQPSSQLIRAFQALSLPDKFEWFFRGLLFQESHQEWRQWIHVCFDLMGKYGNTHVYQGLPIESATVHTSWEQFQLYQWLPFPFKREMRRILRETLDKAIMLEGIPEDPAEQMPMEQRISMMAVSDSVKRRALTKWREVKLKQDEQSSKAKQYVEGLLKIPFGMYREEPCLRLFDQVDETNDSYTTMLEETQCTYTDAQCVQWYKKHLILPTKRKQLMELAVFLNEASEWFGIVEHVIHQEYCKYYIPMVPVRVTGKRQKQIHQLMEQCVQWLLEHASVREFVFVLHAVYCYLEHENESYVSGVSGVSNASGMSVVASTTQASTTKKTNTHNMIHVKQVNPLQDQPLMKSATYPIECFDEFPVIGTLFDKYDMPNKHLNKSPFMSRVLYETLKHKDPWTPIQQTMKEFRQTLESSIHGHTSAKRQLERILGQWMRGEQSGYCFGFEGPPGVGKTSLAKYGLAQCLRDEHGESRPFTFIAMGGSTHGNTLEGHNYTYLGSTWGKLVDILMETKCMNPIIFIDELDKVSRTEQGREIIGILTHLVDPTQNTHIQDKYFSGVDLDFSKALFIFSYNDVEAIDSVLLDRIHRVNFSPLSVKEKCVIAESYLLPELKEKFRMTLPVLSEDVLRHLMHTYTQEAGVRKFKELLFEIMSEYNLETIDHQTRYDHLTIEQCEHYLHDRTPLLHRMVEPFGYGNVNGLWANSLGNGGVITVEATWCPSKEPLQLTLTGSQGDVMRESMTVARTVAWNKLSEHAQTTLSGFQKGIHVHCPEGATPKDGPSAGGAIALAILSLMSKKPISHKIAITGELRLNQQITAIGGLEAKVLGAIRAGVTRVYYPTENERDMKKIREKYPELESQMDTKSVSSFHELVTELWAEEE